MEEKLVARQLCAICGFKIRGANHEQGEHHLTGRNGHLPGVKPTKLALRRQAWEMLSDNLKSDGSHRRPGSHK